MVANLAKPTPTRPALMRHDDVVTYFHEMGHVFHGLLSRTTFGRFHGTRWAPTVVMPWKLPSDLGPQRREGLCGSAFADVGKLVLGAFGSQACIESLRNAEASPG